MNNRELTTIRVEKDITTEDGHRITLFKKERNGEILHGEWSLHIYQNENVISFNELVYARANAIFKTLALKV